jgi:hypothetical protein
LKEIESAEVAVASIVAGRVDGVQGEPGTAADWVRLAGFREGAYRCLTRRPDALFGVGDAVLCAGRPVTDAARLSLVPECGRGHGGVYDGLNAGRADAGGLRRLLAGLPLPRWPDGRIVLAVDVSDWLRPDAETSPERLFCPVRGRGKNAKQMIAGWPYSFVAAIGPGASSWTVLLDAVRLGPADDQTAVTAVQLRAVVERLTEAGQRAEGDPAIMIVMDAGYVASRLAWLLADLPVVLIARVRSDRVFCRRPPARVPGAPGRRRLHGDPVRCDTPATWHDPGVSAVADSARYGPVTVTAWPAVHQGLHRNCPAWKDWPPHEEFPVIEGTLIRLGVTRPAPGHVTVPDPMWLWASDPDAGLDPEAVARLWQAYHRRFDLEHTFRYLKSQLGWDKPLLRDPAAADRWTWLILTCHAQLYLARTIAADIPLPWQRPQPRTGPGQVMTPGRVRAGFPGVRRALGTPASSAKPGTPGPGRPAGSRNTRPAPRHPAGKTTLTPGTIASKKRKQAKQARKTSRLKG